MYSCREDGSYVIFMENAELGDLSAYINSAFEKIKSNRIYRLKEEAIMSIFVQILQGLKDIHSKNLIHRDIKPQNIMIFNNGVVKISDFGITNFAKDSITKIGDPRYVAPEVLKGK